MQAILSQSGTWTPETDPRFRRVFWRPPPTSWDHGWKHDAFINAITEGKADLMQHVFPKKNLWLTLENFAFEIIDDPFEAWLTRAKRHWSDRTSITVQEEKQLQFCLKESHSFGRKHETQRCSVPFLLKVSFAEATG